MKLESFCRRKLRDGMFCFKSLSGHLVVYFCLEQYVLMNPFYIQSFDNVFTCTCTCQYRKKGAISICQRLKTIEEGRGYTCNQWYFPSYNCVPEISVTCKCNMDLFIFLILSLISTISSDFLYIYIFMCYQQLSTCITITIKYTNIRFSLLRFPHEKLHSLDSEQDGLLVMRSITNHKIRPVHYRDNRPHLIAEEIQFELENEEVRLP